MNRRIFLSTLLLPVVVGCSSPDKPSLASDDPALKIPAIRESARSHDQSAVAQLVKDLDSDDAAIRLYSIRGLQEITGNTFGYRYYDDEIQRKPALERWKQWLKQRGSATEPTTAHE